MNSVDLSRHAWQAIVASGMPYVMVGGFAVIFYTFPRTTLDVDFVVAMSMSGIDAVVRHLPPNFILNPQAEMESMTGTYRWIVDVEGEAFSVELFQLGKDPHHQLPSQSGSRLSFPGSAAMFSSQQQRIWLYKSSAGLDRKISSMPRTSSPYKVVG